MDGIEGTAEFLGSPINVDPLNGAQVRVESRTWEADGRAPSRSPLRLRTIIFVALASLALLLAAVGLSGVVAYSVSQRTREIGLRIALGASAQDVVRMVLANATRLSAAGVVLGVVSAYGTTRILSSMVYGVTTHDPWSFAGACAVLLGIAFIASYAPARRAARVDPVIALKAE